ncbi:MAG: sulfotransferase [Rubrobacter sp.]|nr:sulfotransferase [Rubrobacter sp.]
MTDGRTGGERLIFIGGSPRSGTTMVQLMLDAHPGICGGPEFDRVPDIVRLRNGLLQSVGSGRISVFCSKEEVDREVGRLIEGLLLPYAGRRGCEVVSEKTPWNVLVFEDLLEIFPRARFVFCVRDPRAIVSSMLRVGARARAKGSVPVSFTRSVGAAIGTIKTCNDAGFRAAERNDRVLIVSYERLVRRPERETERICRFLDMTWSEEMVRHGEKSHDVEELLDGIWYTREMYDSNPDPSRVHKWRGQLSPYQQAAVVAAFEGDRDLRALGYELSDRELPVTRRAAGRARFKLSAGLENALSKLVSLPASNPSIRRIGRRLLSRAGEIRHPRA